jgi:hypothetical protein
VENSRALVMRMRVGSLLMVLPDALRGHWSLGSLSKCKSEMFYNEEAARLGLVHHSAHATFYVDGATLGCTSLEYRKKP